MFTGLIREIAKVESFEKNRLCISSNFFPKIGDSIAINGSCLTVIETSQNRFCVEISDETKSVVAIENYKGLVHIEPAMRLSDRLEGHIVQGHIDTIGKITKISKLQNGIDFYISLPNEYMKFIIPKGSVAIDGISLTINEVYEDSFRLTIIPHTFENTLFKEYKINRRINIEAFSSGGASP